MVFVKHIFDFLSKTAAQILIKLSAYMHLSKVIQVYQIEVVCPFSIELCNELLGSYTACLFTICYYTLILSVG